MIVCKQHVPTEIHISMFKHKSTCTYTPWLNACKLYPVLTCPIAGRLNELAILTMTILEHYVHIRT